MEQLNDDLLSQIFDFLDEEDRINIWLTCRRFAYLLIGDYGYEKFDFNQAKRFLSPPELTLFFSVNGPRIKTLTVDTRSDLTMEYCDTLVATCPNIEKLYFKSICPHFIRKKIEEDLTADLKKEIEEKNVRACESINQLAKLSILHLRICTTTWDEIILLKNLRELNLTKCYNVKAELMNDVLRRNDNLLRLGISRCTQLQGNLFHCRQDTQLKLIEITIDSDNHEIFDLQLLKKLRYVRLYYHGGDDTDAREKLKDFIDNLARLHHHQIEKLEIISTRRAQHTWSIQTIPALWCLKRLVLANFESMNDDLLRIIAQTCLHLEEVDLTQSLPSTAYPAVLNLIRNLKRLKHLNIADERVESRLSRSELGGIVHMLVLTDPRPKLVLYMRPITIETNLFKRIRTGNCRYLKVAQDREFPQHFTFTEYPYSTEDDCQAD